MELRLAFTDESSHESIDVDSWTHLNHRLHIRRSSDTPAGAGRIRRADERGRLLSRGLGQQQLRVDTVNVRVVWVAMIRDLVQDRRALRRGAGVKCRDGLVGKCIETFRHAHYLK